MIAVKEAREKKEISREEEQEKRYMKYQEDREALEVTRLEDNGLYRVDNMITGGVYFKCIGNFIRLKLFFNVFMLKTQSMSGFARRA